jgi:hypothetical protein
MRERFLCGWAGWAWILMTPALCAEPKVLLYHSFARGLTEPDFAASPVTVSVGKDVKTRPDGIFGPAAEFEDAATDSVLRIGLGTLGKAEAGTLALWQILDSQEPLTVAEQNLLTVLDQDGKPIFQLNKSGHVYVYDGGKRIHLECFDALWWLKNYSGGNKAIGRVETDANIAVWSLDARGEVAHPKHSRGAPFRVK